MRCCIEECEVLTKKDVTYFEFPTSRLLRKRWLDAILPPVSKLAPDARLCSRHFTTDDYEDVRGRVRLRGRVVPTIFGDQAQTKLQADPLGLPDSTTVNEESRDSTGKDKEPTNTDNHNGKTDNDNVPTDKDNGHNDNEKTDKNSTDPKSPRRDATENGHDALTDKKTDTDNGKTDTDNGKTDTDNGKTDTDNGKTDRDNMKTDRDKEKTDRDEEKTDRDKEKTDRDNGKIVSNVNNGIKRPAESSRSKKVRKKWVPMRTMNINGRVVMSEDSSSQDSICSEIPPVPLLEDLEEHLPNYHIANMKTERQIAAMTDCAPPSPSPVPSPSLCPSPSLRLTPPMDLVVEPHVPVFIELSVGQDNNTLDPEEQRNDCLMVLESVQCDIDPTLMLEARAEDEDCCEQIDLDDDDDDLPAPTKTSKPPVDPISLLTSSDEDDVILQEPHIDTLSVSDETDEDDLPLKKLMKRVKRNKKNKKKKKKPPPVKSILVGVADFYCTHCQHVSSCRTTHEKHVKLHLRNENYEERSEPSQPNTRVYQICKECGFTTSSKSQLLRHQRKHLNDKRYKCPLCSYRSKYNMSLMYHLKTHDFDPNMYNCGACGLELDSKKALLDHQSSCYEMAQKFLCALCGDVAKSKRAMKMHRKNVHNLTA